jgi:hypothetical protein
MMTKEANRIYFIDNPYPEGHKIIKFVWSGRIDEDEAIWFDFHLETDDYYADDDSAEEEDSDEDDGTSDWNAKIVWTNYHSCTMSSTDLGEESKGIKVSHHSRKFNFEDCIKNELNVDKLPLLSTDYEDLAFSIYLLGHDSCANHSIIIQQNGQHYDIDWTGKIALTYAGEDDFDYDFVANIQGAQFEGFYYPESWSLEKAKTIFQKNLEHFEQYEFIELESDSNTQARKLVKTIK